MGVESSPLSCIALVSRCLSRFNHPAVVNRSVASEFPAPVPYLPMFPSISATLLVEIRLGVMNRAVASEFPAPVPYLPMFPSISATLLVEIRLGYVLLAYSL